MGNCDCGDTSVLAPITSTSQFLNGLVRMFFQKTFNGTVENAFTVATEDPTLLATWTAAAALTDSEKVIDSPIFNELVVSGSEAIDYTGETANGIPINLGTAPSSWTWKYLNLDQATTIQQLKALQCFVRDNEGLSMFLVNECGDIIGETEDDYTTFKGIPVNYLHIGDVIEFARTAPGSNVATAMLKAGWAANLKVITPTFNAQTVTL